MPNNLETKIPNDKALLKIQGFADSDNRFVGTLQQ
jgi:hypothetical protein